MRDRLQELGRVHVAMITFSTRHAVEAYRTRFDLPFPILLDHDRSTYRAYGLGRATTRRVWNLATLRRYGEILRQGGLGDLRPPTEDTRQLGGDFVIDRRGRLVWGHWSEGPDDRPTIDRLVAAVDAARAAN